MADKEKDIVIVGVGHSTLHENAQSQLLIDPTLLALAKADSGYNAKLNRVTEYRYCVGLAKMIVSELAKLNIVGLISNRYTGADINGNSKSEGAMTAEINAINRALPAYGSRVKAAINLHLNATPSGTGYESYSPDTNIGHKLGAIFDLNIVKVLGIRHRKSLYSNASTRNLRGMGFPRSVRVPACLLELFFVDNNKDLLKGLQLKKELAKAIAHSFKQFCDKDYPPFDAAKALAEANVQSTALVESKLKPRFNDEQIKTVALNTQEKLLPIERELGEGGDKYTFYTKNHIEVVGTRPPTFESTLVDPKGNVSNNMVLRPGGVVTNQTAYPLFQNIDYTSDMPTGKKTIYAHSLYEIKAYETNTDASGHIRLNAGGNIKVTSSQQVDIVSAFNLNLCGDSIINITSNNIAIEGNTTVTGTLGINGGVISNGVIYAQGGLSAPSFNGPAVIDKTNSQELYGYLPQVGTKFMLGPSILTLSKPIMPGDTTISIAEGELMINEIDSGVGAGTAGKALVVIPPHRHYFKRLNGELADNITSIQSNISPSLN